MAKKEVVEKETKEVPTWPIEGRRLVLSKKAVPPTVDGVINIGMEGSIHVPSLEAQQEGFTPYIKRRGHEAEDATDLLLRQYPGIYKPLKEKKGETDNAD